MKNTKENYERYKDIVDKILELDRLKAIISNIESHCKETIKNNKKELQSCPIDEIDSSLDNEISILETILKIIK